MCARRARTVIYIDKATTTSRNLMEELIKSGYEVRFISDFTVGQELLLYGYWHLAILSDRFVSEYPPSQSAYFPNLKKILSCTQDPFWDEDKRNALLNRVGFEDDVENRNLPEAIRKIDRFFNRDYHSFGWNLDLLDCYGQPSRLLGLAELISPPTPENYLTHRANELADLLRSLFYEDCQVRLSSPLWVKEGLACLEVKALREPGYQSERLLLKIGQKEQYDLDRSGYAACRPDTEVAGITKEINYKETVRFGAGKWQLNGRRGQGGRLLTASALLDQHIDPNQVAKAYLDVHLPGSAFYFSHHSSRVDALSTVREHLHLPNNEVLVQKIIRRAEEICQAGWCENASMQVEPDGEGEVKVQVWIGDAPALQLNTADLRRVLLLVDQIKVNDVSTTAPSPLRLENLIVEDLDGDLGLAWLSDFRLVSPTCRLFNLAHCEAELRYNLTHKAGLAERARLEKCLMGQAEASELTHPVVLAAKRAIAQVRELAAGVNPRSYQAAVLLNALARFISPSPELIEANTVEDGVLLLASLALITAQLLGVSHKKAYQLEIGHNKNEFIFNGKHFDLKDSPAEVLILLINLEKDGQALTYHAYKAHISKDPLLGTHDSYIGLLQRYISDIRKKIDEVAGDEHKQTANRIIITVKDVGYKLVLEDSTAEDESLDFPL